MKNQYLNRIRQAGVVGAGGAGFPTHIKLDASVEYVLVNGAECEPLLRANQEMMAVYPAELWKALQTVVEHTGAQHGIIALKKKYERAIAALEKTKPAEAGYSLRILKDFYPAGDEHVLVNEVTGRLVPEGGIPLKVNCVVINIETLFNVLQALEGKPVTKKFVTVTGAVKEPQTFHAPLGTSFVQLIEKAGGSSSGDFALLEGGPMMGKPAGLQDVVTKTTGGLILLPANHPLITRKNLTLKSVIARAKAVCCQCRFCTDLCPRYLLGHAMEPHKIMRNIGAGEYRGYLTNAYLCSECGVCDNYACPMDLSPREINRLLKKELSSQGIKNPHQRGELTPSPMRDMRKVPGSRLIARNGLSLYNVAAPLSPGKFLPQAVCIPLLQHLGRPAHPIVQPGDLVEEGQLIGEISGDAAIGANIHASISGRVLSVDKTVCIKRQ